MDELNEVTTPTVSKKKRNVNFNRDEIYCLVTEYGKRLNILNFGNREQKHACWEEITSEINTLHPDFKRTAEEIKKKWIDLLYATKKEYIKATKEAAMAGDEHRRKLSEISELIVKVRGGFSTKQTKVKNENGVRIINLQIPSTDGTDHPTTIYIPHVDECESNPSDSTPAVQDSTQQSAVMITDPSFNDVSVSQADTSVIDAVTSYHNYTQSATLPSPPQGTQCSCGLSADLIRLKQETLGVLRRQIQIEEERRIEEKQKWWEEKAILRLKRQKLELEVKQLQQQQQQNTVK